MDGIEIDVDEDLRDRILLGVVKCAEMEAEKLQMTVSPQAMNALSGIVMKYLVEVARDVELFAQHAGRKSVNMEDVLLCVRRNQSVKENLAPVVEDLLKFSKKVEKLKKKQDSDEPHVEKVEKVKRRKKDNDDVAEQLRKKQEFEEGDTMRKKFLSKSFVKFQRNSSEAA